MTKKIIGAALGVALLSTGVLSAFADATSTSATSGTATNMVCMQAAIDKRDTAISAAVDGYASAVKSALSTRKDALKAAWGMTDKKARQAAQKAAWRAYDAAAMQARKDFRTARQAAWQTFYADRKACGPKGAAEDGSTSGKDANL